MTTTEQLILEKLSLIESQLSALLVPVAAQQGRQQATLSDEERRANNQALLRASRARRARKTA